MKRLITISLLTTALFMLLGCGFDSKPLEVASPKYELSGEFYGQGEIYTTTDESVIAELRPLVERKKELEFSYHMMQNIARSDLEITSDKDPKEAAKEINQKISENEQKLKERKEDSKTDIIALHSISFEIEKDGKENLTFKKFKITSDRDETIETEDDPETQEDESKNEPEIRYYFGDILKVKFSKILQDSKTGDFSFSMHVTNDKEKYEYRFYGNQEEELNDQKDIKTILLKGEIEVVRKEKEETKNLKPIQKGFWKASQTVIK